MELGTETEVTEAQATEAGPRQPDSYHPGAVRSVLAFSAAVLLAAAANLRTKTWSVVWSANGAGGRFSGA